MSARPGMAQASHRPTLTRPNLHWQELAACVDHDANLWFEPDSYHMALAVCSRCPVKAPCRELGRGQAEGVWGGRAHNHGRGRHSKR